MKRRIQNNPAATLARPLILGMSIMLSGNVLAKDYATTDALAAEAAARGNADTALQGSIAAEASARENADTTLQANINTEASARGTADATLQASIATVSTARQAGDTTLQNNIATETSARQAGDTTLQTNITAVSSARLAGDNTLQANINTEASARGTADTTLQGNIAAEASARRTAVQALQGQINNLPSPVPPPPVGYGGVLQVCGNTGILQWQPCHYAIGDTGPAGGIVFYITANGLHGLEAAPHDQSTAAPWGCDGQTISGADGAGIGAGAQNTADILAGCKALGIAARLADEYEVNGYTDWFLPSKDELNQMYLNIGQGAPAPNTNVGGFAIVTYWSSTEGGSTLAWLQHFGSGTQLNYDGKYDALRVRAVRAF